jgi:AcrR family transcriptional regulator
MTTPKRKPGTLQKEEFQPEQSTRNRILDIAIDLFSKKGFSAVSVREITRTVGIRESSLYNHFKSKDEIMDTIFDYFVSELAKMNPPEQNLDELIATSSAIEVFRAHAGLFKKGMKCPNTERSANHHN